MPTAESTRSALKLWVVLARTYGAILCHAEADVAQHGLTLAEFGILEALFHKGTMRLGELQQKVLVTSGGTTYLVDRLIDKGWVRREECPEDRRVRYASLTPAGKALMDRIFDSHAACITRAVSGLTPTEQATVTALLKTLGRSAAASGLTSARES